MRAPVLLLLSLPSNCRDGRVRVLGSRGAPWDGLGAFCSFHFRASAARGPLVDSTEKSNSSRSRLRGAREVAIDGFLCSADLETTP